MGVIHRAQLRPCFCTTCLCQVRGISTAGRVCRSCAAGDHYPNPRPRSATCRHGQAFVDGHGANATVRCRYCLLVLPTPAA